MVIADIWERKGKRFNQCLWKRGYIVSIYGVFYRVDNIPFVLPVATVLLVALGLGGCLVVTVVEVEKGLSCDIRGIGLGGC